MSVENKCEAISFQMQAVLSFQMAVTTTLSPSMDVGQISKALGTALDAINELGYTVAVWNKCARAASVPNMIVDLQFEADESSKPEFGSEEFLCSKLAKILSWCYKVPVRAGQVAVILDKMQQERVLLFKLK